MSTTPSSTPPTSPLSKVVVDYFTDTNAVLCVDNMGGATAPRLKVRPVKQQYTTIEDIF